jgi:hypothetical protein
LNLNPPAPPGPFISPNSQASISESEAAENTEEAN